MSLLPPLLRGCSAADLVAYGRVQFLSLVQEHAAALLDFSEPLPKRTRAQRELLTHREGPNCQFFIS